MAGNKPKINVEKIREKTRTQSKGKSTSCNVNY